VYGAGAATATGAATAKGATAKGAATKSPLGAAWQAMAKNERTTFDQNQIKLTKNI
jgi:hypothetical protein